VVVAALNIIASLVLLVMEKTRDIGIMIAMGAKASQIKSIFLAGALSAWLGRPSGWALVFSGAGWLILSN